MLFRVAYFIPYIVATVVSGASAELLNPTRASARPVKLDHWLANVNFSATAPRARAVAFVNTGSGGLPVVIFCRMQAVIRPVRGSPHRGANAWQEFWHTPSRHSPHLSFLADDGDLVS